METFYPLLAICAVNSPHKGQWRGALMFPLICVGINGWVNNREAGELRRYHANYGVTVVSSGGFLSQMARSGNVLYTIRLIRPLVNIQRHLWQILSTGWRNLLGHILHGYFPGLGWVFSFQHIKGCGSREDVYTSSIKYHSLSCLVAAKNRVAL